MNIIKVQKFSARFARQPIYSWTNSNSSPPGLINDKHWLAPKTLNTWIPVTNWQHSNEDAPPLAIIANNRYTHCNTHNATEDRPILHCVHREGLHIILHIIMVLCPTLCLFDSDGVHDISNVLCNVTSGGSRGAWGGKAPKKFFLSFIKYIFLCKLWINFTTWLCKLAKPQGMACFYKALAVK